MENQKGYSRWTALLNKYLDQRITPEELERFNKQKAVSATKRDFFELFDDPATFSKRCTLYTKAEADAAAAASWQRFITRHPKILWKENRLIRNHLKRGKAGPKRVKCKRIKYS